MNATAEIDKAGRLVIPKSIRDSLNLIPGTRVTFTQVGDCVRIESESKPRGLYWDRGWPVYDGGPAPGLEDVDWVQWDRDQRMNSLMRDHDD